MIPTIFIGSSLESLDIAKAIQANFSHYEIFTDIWSQGIFSSFGFPLEDFLRRLEDYDFGIFVFTPDDLVKIRNQELEAIRDNVVFELGLFIGKLGRERAFLVMPEINHPIRVASDLLGLKPALYNPKNPHKQAALGVACEEMRAVIDRLGPKFRLPQPLHHFVQKAKSANDDQVYMYTFYGLQPERDLNVTRNTTVELSSVYRLWSDPTSEENFIQATVVLDEEPAFYRIRFKNVAGSYPANATLRPCGFYPLLNTSKKKCIAFDARAVHTNSDPANRCSKEIGLSIRLIDGIGTMWNKGISDPRQERLPTDEKWRTFHIDLTKEWFLFGADGNHYYATDKDKIDFSIIAAIEIELGSRGGPRLGDGYGQVELTNIRLCDLDNQD